MLDWGFMSRGGATWAVAIACALVACATHGAPRAPAPPATPPPAPPPASDAAHARPVHDVGVDVRDQHEATVLDHGPSPSAIGGGLGPATAAIGVRPTAPLPAPEVPAPLELPLDDGMGGAPRVTGHDVPGYVAFTFDDGPHPAWTPRVLAALAAHDVHATFFVIGRQVWGLDHPARRRELAAIAAAGHDIGNHTWSHARLTDLGPLARAREIDQASAVITWITGRPVTMLRAPYGDSDPAITALLRRRGLTEIGWNLDPRDWDARSPAVLRRRVVDRILDAGGGVLVLHDDKWITAQALPGILADLEAANCRRIAGGLRPILPVSLHYFTGRAVPVWVDARTRAYRAALDARCHAAGATTDASGPDDR
jgi:peptidoglycan/xylan/chitin deacetylase (PgdA/CDA1 family)